MTKTTKTGWALAALTAALFAAQPAMAQSGTATGTTGATAGATASTSSSGTSISGGAATGAGVANSTAPLASPQAAPIANVEPAVSAQGTVAMGAAPAGTRVVTRTWVGLPADVEARSDFRRWMALR
jgi:hypothetical protein